MKPLRVITILKQKLPGLFCGVALLLAQTALAQTVTYTATPTTGPAPLQVNFTSPSVDSMGNTIISWNWNFGDGVTSTNQNPTNLYGSIGIFTPVLTVTNSLEAAIVATGPSVDVIPATGVITWINTNGGLWNVATNWSPNQVPSSTNTVLITTPGTYAVILNVITNVANLIVGTGSTNNGVQTLQISNLPFDATNALINTGGLLRLTNSTVTGVFNIAGGAVFSANEATVAAQVTVASGGKMLFLGTASDIGADGDTNNPNDWLWLQEGAQLYANSQLLVFAPITNSGTCYMTNGGFNSFNTGISEDDGGLVNLTNGVINLIGGSEITGTGSGCYVTNQGTINAITGVNGVNVGFALLTGTYNAAAGATMVFGADTSPGTSPGAGLTLNGTGRFEFGEGLLTLASNTIPNVQMTFGTLELGPNFQGGAITNLTLDGINFSNINALPVTGTLVVSNDSELSGPFLVTGPEGVLNINSAIIYAQVTVASGGELQLTGGAYLGDAGFLGDTNCWLLLQSGSQLTAAAGSELNIYAPMTNSGTCFVTNADFFVYNDMLTEFGALVNLPGGVINLINSAVITSSGAFATVANQGTINATNGANYINVGSGLLTGTYNAPVGTIVEFAASTSPGTSAGAGLALGGGGEFELYSGTLMMASNTIPDLTLTGGTLVLGTNFQGGVITNLTLDGTSLSNTLPVTGRFAVTNSILNGSFVVSNGAVFSVDAVTLAAQVTVEGGGKMLLVGSPTYVGNGAGTPNNTNYWLWMQSGAQMNAGSTMILFSPMTNSGTCYMTNEGFEIFNNNTAEEAGSLVNTAGGVIYLVNSAGIGVAALIGSLQNQGTIIATNGVSIINVGSELLSGAYTATNATIDFQADASPGTSVGAGLTLTAGGGGVFFNTGLLTLSNNTVPNLSLTGGTLELGANFQGGAITNLVLDGIVLTNNTLPVTGTLTVTNSTLYGSYPVADGAVFDINHATLNAQVTVENGGQMQVYGVSLSSLGSSANPGNSNYWLWLQSGAQLNGNADFLELYAPMTNSGTCSMTNEGLSIANNGMNEFGGLVNLPGGVINLVAGAGIGSFFTSPYLVNQGAINAFSIGGTSLINVVNITNTATLSAQHGTLELEGANLNLQPSGTLSVGLNSAADYGTIYINTNSLNLSQIGSFQATLNGGFVPATNNSFRVLTYPLSTTGNFAATNLPPEETWQTTYGATNLTIKVIALNIPTVQFTASPTTGPAPLMVNFTSPSMDSAGNTITSWNWNFGDGVGTSTIQNPTYTYTNAGNYTPSLTVTNTNLFAIVATGPFIAAIPGFSFALTSGTLNTARSAQTSTLLPNGLVLTVGGMAANGSVLSSAELYNPATGTWTDTGSLNTARENHTATLLTNGLVLVEGGFSSTNSFISSAELYNPATGIWTATGSLNTTRESFTATLLTNGQVLVAGGSDIAFLSSAELYNPATGTWTTINPMNTTHSSHTATLLTNGMVLVAGGFSGIAGADIATAELYNPATGTWTATNSMNFARQNHTATLLPGGQVLVAGGESNNIAMTNAELYNPSTGTWTTTGSLNYARYSQTANLLPDGLALVAGGGSGEGVFLSSAELYDPATGAWTVTSPLNTSRGVHTSTLLPSGQLLIAGGINALNILATNSELAVPATNSPPGTWTTTNSLKTARYLQSANLLPNGLVLVEGGVGNAGVLSNAELFNPASVTWTNTGSLNTAREFFTSTLLTNGQMLVAGGAGNGSYLASAELYNPAAGAWINTGSLNIGRQYHTATLLTNGQVLAVGGFGISGYLSTAELFNPATGAWTNTGSLNTAREFHVATLLTNGQVLVAGGFNGTNVASAELYNPATGAWTNTGPLPLDTVGYNSTMTLLPNGQVLVAAGFNGDTTLTNAELYNPATGTWTNTGSLNNMRQEHTAALLPDGQVLVVGGENNSGRVGSAELYNPATGIWTLSGSLNNARYNHTATLLPNGLVLVAGGIGTNGILSNSELYNVGLGFSASWQPQITSAGSPLIPGGALEITGSLFRGVSEGSGGNGSQDSPADYPIVQLLSLESGQTMFLSPASWSTNSYISGPVTNFPMGYALVTAFVNGIPSAGSIIQVGFPLASNTFQFTASPTTGPAPLMVNFTSPNMDSEGNAITSWSWNFGDGVGTSTLQNPTYTYTNAGTYTPVLSVTNSLDNLIVAENVSIVVSPGLLENFSVQVTNTSNLLGYWPFTPASQANSTVNGYTGAFVSDAGVGPPGSGPTLQNLSNNTAVILDGNRSYVNTSLTGGLSSTGPNADQGSIIGWFELTNLPSIAEHYFTIAGESEEGNDFDLQIDLDNELHFYTDSGSSTVDPIALTASDFGIWHFVAATFTSGSSRNIYVDGALVASSVPGTHNAGGDGTFAMGASDVFTGRYFQGALADIAVFNRELTATEVSNLYAVANFNNAGSVVTLTSPVNGQVFSAPAAITLSATVTNVLTNASVAFYNGTALLGTVTGPPYTISSNFAAGSYAFSAVATDTNGISGASAVAYVTVNGAGANLIDFDPLADDGAVVGGAALSDYLAQFNVGLVNNSPGTTVVAENQDSVAGGGFVIASSPPNVLTQTGSNGPVSFTVNFTNLLSQFSFTRPELVANPLVSHPAWQAQAFDSLGILLDEVQEGQISSSTTVPEQTYTLSGGSIASVEFSSEGTGLTTFNAMLLDNFVLLAGNAGNLPPSVFISSPVNGQVFAEATAIAIAVETTPGSGTVTGVGFYYDGVLAASTQSSPFSIQGPLPANGVHVLTAVVTNSAGLTSTSAPVSFTLANGFAILTPPQSQTIGLGGKATFSVTTTGTDVTYQWRINGTNILGASASSYTVHNATTNAQGNYTVVVTSDGQFIISPAAVLTVLGPPTLGAPSIVTNNGNITLSVSASDAVAYYYQWQLNGNGIAGATASNLTGPTVISYTITNARPFDSGDYQVVVANAVASEESPDFEVAVSFGTPITTNDNFASSLVIGPLTNGVGVAGVNNSSSLPPADGPALIAGKPAAGFLWYSWTADFSGVISLTTRGSSFDTLLGVYTGSSLNALTPVAEDDDSGGFFTSLVTFNCTNGTTYHMAVAGYQGDTGTVEFGLSPGPPLLPGPVNGYNVGGAEPVITQQPVNQLVQAGATVTLSVTATNATGYQWYLATAPVSGGTASVLVLSNFPASAVGNYFVLVSNAVGTVQSASAAVQIATVNQTKLLEDKFGDAVDLSAIVTTERYRPTDGGGETGGFTLSQSFSTAGATKEEGEPNHAGQPGGASYWYSYTATNNGTITFNSTGSTFNTILAVYIGPGTSFSTLTNVGSAYITNYPQQSQPSVVVSNVVTGTKYFIAIDGYLGASGAAQLNIAQPAPPPNTNAVDITNNTPAVAITAPANNSLAASSNITVKGTVKGSPAASLVQVSVNNGPFGRAALSGTAWSTNVTLVAGANFITAQSIATLGTNTNAVFTSLPVTRIVFYNASKPSPSIKAPLTLLTNGSGKITGQAGGNDLEIGKLITIKAVPIGNWVFANWNSGTNTNDLSPLPDGSSLVFDMTSNLIVQANFATNPFTALAGVYNGLFYPDTGVTEASSGFVTATLPAKGTGTYSAKLLLDGGSYPFSGLFDLSLFTEQIVARSGKTSLTVDLQLTTNDQMTGNVTENAPNGWTSTLTADLAVFSKTNPATNYAGKYTLIIPPGSTAPVSEPGGYGYATMASTSAGLVTLSGSLADNTAISQSVTVSKNGDIPLYVSLYSKKGSLLGWLALTNDTNPNLPAQTILGAGLAWIKTNLSGKGLYAGGFTNTNLTVLGSLYTNNFTLTGSNLLTFSNGNLAGALIYSNLTMTGNKLTSPGNEVTGTIAPSTGVLTVTFKTGGHTVTAKGVVLQDATGTNAAGWFPGSDQSGFFLLQQQ